MQKANAEIRNKIAEHRLYYWEVAEALKVNPCTFTRWLRTELEPEKKELILKVIDDIR